jgi:hypothetical protein
MILVLFLLGGTAGVAFWNTIAGRFEGDRLERSLRIPVGRYYLHVHHWFYCLGLLGFFYSYDAAGPGAFGFLAGSILQGLTYRDWYLLVYEKAKGEEMYARWRP